MALPKLQQSVHTITLPFSKKQIQIRPYSLGDERILLQAAEEKDNNAKFYVDNTITVLSNCVVTTDVDLETLPSIDVEYALLQVRSISQGETVEIEFKDEDGKTQQTSIPLKSIYATARTKDDYRIEITKDVGIIMKELTFRRKMEIASIASDKRSEMIFSLIVDSVESIYDANEVYTVGVNTTRDEVNEFLMQASGISTKLYKFIRQLPQLKVDITVNNAVKTLTGSEISFLV